MAFAKTTPRRANFSASGLSITPIAGLPEIQKGHSLAGLIAECAARQRFSFRDGDVVVVAQKIISKAEGRVVSLENIRPSPRARRLARRLPHDAAFVEVVLRESRRIVRRGPRVLIVETRHGFICANAGVDRSNVPGANSVTLLPKNPDFSARRLAAALRHRTRKRVAVIISDTFGRPWRLGLVNVAVGAAGLPVLLDFRGRRDRAGKRLHATIEAVADELAAAAGLLMDKSAGLPVVVIRGLRLPLRQESAKRLIRPPHEDLFR